MKKIFFCFLITITALGLMSSFSFAYAQTLPDSRTLISSTPPGGDSAVEHSDGTGGQEQPPSTNSVGLKCGAGFGTGNPIDCLTLAIAWVGALFIWIIGWIFSIASSFFEMMLRVSIEYFDQYANLQGVKTAWITGRNLANIFLG